MSDTPYKIDLHTHSIISYDGGIDEKGYQRILESGILDVVTITDHNEISFAQKLKVKLGEKIIVGEEIDTSDGQLIGLFLEEKIEPGLSPKQACRQIHEQGGIVYAPHPFEAIRLSMQRVVLENIVKDVDIIEVFNARGVMRGKPAEAQAFAEQFGLAMAASSDAHGIRGLGTSYSIAEQLPESKTIVHLLNNANFKKKYAPLLTYFSPKFNSLKRKYAF